MRFVLLTGSLGFLSPLVCRAEVMAEWKLEAKTDSPGGSILIMDTVPAKASASSELLKESKYVAAATGLGDAWQLYLRFGYLDIKSGTGDAAKNAHGLITKESAPGAKDGRFSNYLGQAGIREDKGGAVYLVFSPQGDWKSDKRKGLMGTGHRGDGYIGLSVKGGIIGVEVGGRMLGAMDIAESKTEMNFEIGKWYFVGASWRGGHNPVLYIREMNGGGPSASPAGRAGKFDSVCGIFEQPKYDPIVIGSLWFNAGGEAVATDGADAKIAFVRIDNTYAKIKEMESVFDSLGVLSKP